MKSCGCLRAEYNKSPKAKQLFQARIAKRATRWADADAAFINHGGNHGVDPDDLITNELDEIGVAVRVGARIPPPQPPTVQDALSVAERLERAGIPLDLSDT